MCHKGWRRLIKARGLIGPGGVVEALNLRVRQGTEGSRELIIYDQLDENLEFPMRFETVPMLGSDGLIYLTPPKHHGTSFGAFAAMRLSHLL